MPLDQIDDLDPFFHKEALHFPTKSIAANPVTFILTPLQQHLLKVLAGHVSSAFAADCLPVIRLVPYCLLCFPVTVVVCLNFPWTPVFGFLFPLSSSPFCLVPVPILKSHLIFSHTDKSHVQTLQ